VAYAANWYQSLSDFYPSPITGNKTVSIDYRGHNELAVLKCVLGHRFLLYRDPDTHTQSTSGLRQLQDKLIPGEPTEN
jgi:hypothetical protein